MKDLRELKTKASEAFAKGKFAKAADLYHDYCEGDPKDLHARLRMGDAWAKTGKKDKAIIAYKTAAEGFARDGFLPRAIAASKLILELDPKHQGVQQMLAELYAKKGVPGDSKAKKPPAPEVKPPGKPAASTSFADRPDAIELPPDDDKPKAAPAVPPKAPPAAPEPVAPKPRAEPPVAARAPARAVIDDSTAPEEVSDLEEVEEIEVEDGSGGTVSGEIDVPIEGVEISPEKGLPTPTEKELTVDFSADLPPELQVPTTAAGPASPVAPPASPTRVPPPPQGMAASSAPSPVPLVGPPHSAPPPAAHIAPIPLAAPPYVAPALAAVASTKPVPLAAPPLAAAPLPLPAPPASVTPSAPQSPVPQAALLHAAPAAAEAKASTAPPGMRPKRPDAALGSADTGARLSATAIPTPESSAAAPRAEPVAAASSRIWMPPAFAGATPQTSDAAPAAAAPAAPAPPGKRRSDRQAGLDALSKFSEIDVDLDAPLPASPAIRASPSAVAARVAPAATPAAPTPAVRPARPKPAGMPSFTELELDGDSILHAIETAALAGLASRGQDEGGAEEAEEVLDTPADLAAEKPSADGLPQIPLFSDLPPDAFIELFERCPLRRFSEGEAIFEQGSVGDAFYVICGGSVRVFRREAAEKKPIATLPEGAFFGEMALLSGAPRTASVESASEETQLLEISAPVLGQLSHQYPQVAQALKKFCRQRLLANVMNASPLFQPFNRDDRRALVERFRARDVNKGDAIVKEGEKSDGLYVVLSGEVDVHKGQTRLAQLKEGDVFGEMSLLSKTPATATVSASKHTSLLRLPRKDFDELILSHPQILVLISDLTDDRRRKTEAALGGAAGSAEEGLLLV